MLLLGITNILFHLKGSLLVNIARGGLLDYNAVHQHLQSGHLGGLAIDVAWTEPFDPEDPILKFPNVLITPHVAGVTEYSYRTMAKVYILYFSHLVLNNLICHFCIFILRFSCLLLVKSNCWRIIA